MNTIVDTSIRELQRRRAETDENRLKIIASALNYEHCHQVVEAYRARGQRADYVHSREDSVANKRVMQRLEDHEIDVIVQVRKLGEGFDHPFLAVAAVFSVFANLSPFIQFVGRIMRVIRQNAPGHALNQGTVIFHAGANVASRWEDFQQYSEADRDFFSQLLPVENLDFSDGNELEVEPQPRNFGVGDGINVHAQTDVQLEEIPLIENADAMAALQMLRDAGYTVEQVQQEFERLVPVPVTRVRQRQAMRSSLDARIRTEVGRVLAERGINHDGHDLDRQRLGRSNFILVKSAIDRAVNQSVGRGTGNRDEFTRVELDQINNSFVEILAGTLEGIFNG